MSHLGGAPGIAFLDAAHTVAAPRPDVVVHDATDHRGRARTYDPWVGGWGGPTADRCRSLQRPSTRG